MAGSCLTRFAAIALVAALCLGADDAASPDVREGPIAVQTALAPDTLSEVALGLAQRARWRIEPTAVGLVTGSRTQPGARTEEILSSAAEAGASHAVLLDLVESESELAVGVRAYELESRRLVAVARETAEEGAVDEAADRALEVLFERLGFDALELSRVSRQRTGELAALGRALRAIDREELLAAWHELSTRGSPALTRLRAEVESLARAAGDVGYARVLTARGEMDRAWELLAPALEEGADSQSGDLALAMGEIQLERGRVDEAIPHFERALRLDARSTDAHLGLGRAFSLQGESQRARESYERAAELLPSSPRPLELAAEIPDRDSAARARQFFTAGERAALQLSPERASENFGRALRLEPELAAEARDQDALLKTRLHDFESALHAYEDAIELDQATPERLRGAARVQSILGDSEGAEARYLQVLEQNPNDPAALHQLGELYLEVGRVADAAPLLERARGIAPEDPGILRSLAWLLQSEGEELRALELYAEADRLAPATPRDLARVAALEQKQGDLSAARLRLERAIDLDPTREPLRERLAALHRNSGDEEAARQAELVLLGPAFAIPVLDEEPEEAEPSDPDTFAGLVESFELPEPGAGETAFLGVRLAALEKYSLRSWLHPKRPHLHRIERSLLAAMKSRLPAEKRSPSERSTREAVRELFRFESPSSLEPSLVARVNRELGTDAVFAARVSEVMAKDSVCSPETHQAELELRLLSGQLSKEVGALGNKLCLPPELYPLTWNERAAVIYLAVLALLLFPVVRGWGRVEVHFRLPPKTKPLFGVRLSRRKARAIKSEEDTGNEDANRWQIERKLHRLSLFEKRLTGEKMLFRWVPARRRPYYVTVRGPMVSALTGDLVGVFQEQKQVRARRGVTTRVEFDMRPKESSVEVKVYLGEELAPNGNVALRGEARSLRYARGKSAFLYVKPGEHTVIAATEDRLAVQVIRVKTVEPVKLSFDLASEESLLFRPCAEAVSCYLQADFLGAGDALERDGQTEVANRIRAEAHLQSGRSDLAATAFEAAGELAKAAELRGATNDPRSAQLFEEAGEYRRAGEVHLAQGDRASAARAFEHSGDWDRAMDCYRELGNTDGLFDVLMRSGDYFEAGQLAEELGDPHRALRAYQEIDERHQRHHEVCCRIGLIYAVQEEPELAIEKLAEARELMGRGFPLQAHVELIDLLEQLDRLDDALESLEALRRHPQAPADTGARIEELRKRIAQQTQPASTATEPLASRYEILDQLGHGGMGVVYKARDTHLGRIVALKKLPESLKDHPTAVKLFLREARSAAALNHPNVVTVHDAGQDDDGYFITMECLEGTGLDALLKAHGRLQPRDVALLGVQAAAGLQYAHENGIIHRDIKSSNLFYTTDRVVKIMDFGLAKAVEEVRKAATSIAGTPYYMAPEQSAGEAVDHKADLYAFGVTLYQLVTGRVPFHSGDVAYHHRHTAPPDPREFVPELSAEFAELLLHLLAKRPQDRPANAGEVTERLRSIAESLPRTDD